jgi:hypothetical protein
MAGKSYESEKRKAKWGGGPFIGIARDFFSSHLLASLSPYAAKLLWDLLAQYNGTNNGDLTIAWKIMEKRGWSGRSTLNKAQKELLACGLLILTRQGGRHRPSLYALSLLSIDECKGKLEEVRPTQEPLRTWLLAEQKLRAAAQSKAAQIKKPDPPRGTHYQ